MFSDSFVAPIPCAKPWPPLLAATSIMRHLTIRVRLEVHVARKGNRLQRVDTRNQEVRFPRAPSGRIGPLSASSGIQVSLLGPMGDQPWGPWMQVPDQSPLPRKAVLILGVLSLHSKVLNVGPSVGTQIFGHFA